MPRRHSVASHACELCRQRKRKCDGDGLNTCRACHEAAVDCVYLASTRVSKANLREEVARLRSINSDNNVLLDALSSPNTSPAQLGDILQRLCDGQPRAEVAELLTQSPDRRRGSSLGGSSASLPTSLSPRTLLASTGASSRGSIPSDTTPPIMRSPREANFQADLRHYRPHIPQLLDAILTGDCLSFCPIRKDAFLRAFESETDQHCSPALVSTLLALATLLVPEKMAALAASSPGGSSPEGLGYAFAQDAVASLYNGERLPRRIADIQAIGILALYSFCGGEMKDGLGFAGDYGIAIATRWERKDDEATLPDRETCAYIYCAAVSFNRLFFLIEDYQKTLDELAIEVGIERPVLHDANSAVFTTNISGSMTDDIFFMRDFSLSPDDPKVLAAKLFEFAEWVYEARCNPDKTMEQAIEVYQNGLHWYDTLFEYTRKCSSQTPFTLFTHAYYQFGVMCLLTPYVLESIPITSDGTLPMAACRQAAGDIAQLVQHYGKLYNEANVFDFMTFFKTAMFSFLEICNAKIPT